jgi:hypothetical protein
MERTGFPGKIERSLACARSAYIALGSAQNKEDWNRLILGKINLPQHFATSNLAS